MSSDNRPVIFLDISNDPTNLGPDATHSDLHAYSRQLALDLGDKHECVVVVFTKSVDKPTTRRGGDFDALALAVQETCREWHAGDEWVRVLERAMENQS